MRKTMFAALLPCLMGVGACAEDEGGSPLAYVAPFNGQSMVAPDTDWRTGAFRGEESAEHMNAADFALLEHHLVTRVLAHRDTRTRRWTYTHLHDLAFLHPEELGTGWVDCLGDCATDTELDRFVASLARWAPALEWRAAP